MTEVLGRPVSGKIVEYGKPDVEQWPDEKFIELLDAVLDDPQVHSVRWRQYTPYFNDGDACEFGVGEVYVRLKSTEDDNEDGDYGDGYIGTYEMRANRSDWRDDTVKPELATVARALRNFEGLGHFQQLLKRSFGDHAIVTATRDGFDVEFHEHD